MPASATAVFFGASYHADYATLLAAPGDLDAVGRRPGRLPRRAPERRPGTSSTCAGCAAAIRRPRRWPRRSADGKRAAGWTLNLEREDVCPVVTLPDGADFEGFLAGLGKKERHEIRRKLRRAEAVGPITLTRSADPLADLPAFIELHQKRWGAEGLFPDDRRRGDEPALLRPPVRAARAGRAARPVVPGRRRPDGSGRASTSTTATSLLYYNAGIDPGRPRAEPGRADGRQLRPGGPRRRIPADGLPARRRAVQVRMGRAGRADPAPPRAPERSADDPADRRRSLPRAARLAGRRRWPGPGRRDPGDGHERRRPGASLLAPQPPRSGLATTRA